MDNRETSTQTDPTPQKTLKKGMRVRVFNHAGEDFTAVVRAVNKTTARVECEDKYPPFTNHLPARNEDNYDHEAILVPFRDVTII